jgi:hypothetical protein
MLYKKYYQIFILKVLGKLIKINEIINVEIDVQGVIMLLNSGGQESVADCRLLESKLEEPLILPVCGGRLLQLPSTVRFQRGGTDRVGTDRHSAPAEDHREACNYLSRRVGRWLG